MRQATPLALILNFNEMKKYKIKINYEEEIEAEDKDEAINKCLEMIATTPQQTFGTFLAEVMEAEETDQDKMSKSFQVSSVCREDLKDYMSEKEIKKITDDEMRVVANKLADGIHAVDSYWLSLEEALRYFEFIK